MHQLMLLFLEKFIKKLKIKFNSKKLIIMIINIYIKTLNNFIKYYSLIKIS